MPDDCLFCQMRDGAIPVEKIAQNEYAFAIRDINPRAPIHVLIIPNEHIPTAKDLTADHGQALVGVFTLATEVAKLEGVFEPGYRLAFNIGEAAGMTIYHLHLHLVGGRKLGPEG